MSMRGGNGAEESAEKIANLEHFAEYNMWEVDERDELINVLKHASVGDNQEIQELHQVCEIYRAALTKIGEAAGHHATAEGCRVILGVVKEALEEV